MLYADSFIIIFIIYEETHISINITYIILSSKIGNMLINKELKYIIYNLLNRSNCYNKT